MSNIEHLKPMPNTNAGACIKAQQITDGQADILERLRFLLDKIRGTDISKLSVVPREKAGVGLPTNLDEIARMQAQIDTTLSDIEAIF